MITLHIVQLIYNPTEYKYNFISLVSNISSLVLRYLIGWFLFGKFVLHKI